MAAHNLRISVSCVILPGVTRRDLPHMRQDRGSRGTLRLGAQAAASCTRSALLPSAAQVHQRCCMESLCQPGAVQALVVVGTSQGWGEDYPCQGRLIPIRVEPTSRGGRGHVLSSRRA